MILAESETIEINTKDKKKEAVCRLFSAPGKTVA